MNNRLAILLPDLRGGGAERVMVNLANAMVARGYAVEIVLLSRTGEFISELRSEVTVVDLRVRRLRGALIPLMRYLWRARPNALLACMWPLTIIALWARRLGRLSTRVIVAEHITWSKEEAISRLGRWLVRCTMHNTFPWSDGVVIVSQDAADDLARFSNIPRKDIAVIYNPVVGEPAFQTPLTTIPENWWFGAHRRILAVGALKAAKDFPTLLLAFKRLREHVDARLLILGEGGCRVALETQARELGLDGVVFMPGFEKNIGPFYRHADLVVLSSVVEGLPTVLIEALEAGTPVVSTDCPSGPREILCEGKYGRLAPVGDVPALADAMAWSLATSHDRLALNARAQDFSIAKAADQYEELLFPSASRRGAA